jgi:membrane-associated phospholipid phosphatase
VPLRKVCLLMLASTIVGLPCWSQEPRAAAVNATESARGSASRPAVKKIPPAALKPADGFANYDNRIGMPVLKHILLDQKAIWTSPAHLQLRDASWLVPLGGLTAGFLATDSPASLSLSNAPHRLDRMNRFSNYGLGALIGAGGGLYLWGRITGDEHKRETGVLTGEAVLSALAVSMLLQNLTRRERANVDNARGRLGEGGSSFPSDHAAAVWAVAGIIAHEYPGPLTKLLAYGTASAVSAARVTSKKHFPSDVLVGSAVGWLVASHVYRTHHNPELAGDSWEPFSWLKGGEREQNWNSLGSSFAPLDSWVYPAFDRLAALGYLQTAFLGMRPWTRIACARLTDEATEVFRQNEAVPEEIAALHARLQQEFSYELKVLDGKRNLTANLETVYARTVSISGAPLTDSYHFGQTISYDFGRPFRRGTNGQIGGAFRAAAGPVALYIRAEFQHAPSAPVLSDAVRQVIALRDFVPLPPALASNTVNRPRLLDAYLTLNLNNWQISIGKQSLSWAPGPGGSLLWSDNSEPIKMVRLSNPEPLRMPGFLRLLGPAKFDQFFGRLEGHSFIPRPFIYAQKVSFKPFPFLELGYGRTSTIGGKGGDALTAGNFVASFFGHSSKRIGSVPGDGHAAMDWTFYVPKVRNYIVFYGEVYADDDFIPWQNPATNPFRPGIYIPRIPGIPKLDFHLEAVSTESPGFNLGNQGNLNYWNAKYHDGYTNNGNVIGNTVGRMGRSIQFWFTYWASPRDTFQFTFKHSSVSADFIPGGGAWQDYGLRNETYLRSGLYLKSELQYEHISRFPILSGNPQQNLTAIVELGFSPEKSK